MRPHSDPSDRQLLELMRQGDADAGAAIQLRHGRQLLAFAQRMLGDADRAEDLLQDCLLRAATTDPIPDNFRPWAFKTLRRLCLNAIRALGRRQDRQRLDTGLEVPAEATGQLTRLIRAEDAEALRATLNQLSIAQREVLELRYIDALERSEIAEVLDLSVAVVKSRLFEGLQRLRQLNGL